MTDEKNFGKYIEKLRKEQGFSLKNLCEGVCDETFFFRIETGEREAGKLMQDRFLERLGIAPENYENFLYHEEYDRWYERQSILQNFRREHLEETHQLLEQYKKKYDMKNPLERQFVLLLTAYIKRYEGATEAEIGATFKEAAELTIHDMEQQPKDGVALSVLELDLLLEIMRYFRQSNRTSAYLRLLVYLKERNFTELAQAKCVPKTVYYLYLSWKKEKTVSVAELLSLCNYALELLRTMRRSFYLSELLHVKKELLETEEREYSIGDRIFPEEKMKELRDCSEFLAMWESLCVEWNQPTKMFDCSYLYVDLEAYCIEDVIRIRRKMLGMTMRELSEGICAERTISRLERKKCRPQRAVVRALFERLGLSTELCMKEYISANCEVPGKLLELKQAIREKRIEQAKEILEYLQNQKECNEPVNQQYILRVSFAVSQLETKIAQKEKLTMLKKALECTISYNTVVQKGEKYLTNGEISCIQNMLVQMDNTHPEELQLMLTLTQLYEKKLLIEGYTSMYFFVMKSVACHWGNRGGFEKSNEIERKLIETGFQMYRMHFLHKSLYALLWNKKQKTLHSIEKQRNTELMKCLQIAEFCKEYKIAEFYAEKIKEDIT